MDHFVQQSRRGIGQTRPVGWKSIPPPCEAVRAKILENIRLRQQKEEKDRAMRVARAKEREKKVDMCTSHQEEIAKIDIKIKSIDERIFELGVLKSKIFSELKEVVAKEKIERKKQSL
ncbi:unnamed protein product [Dracunculus medinensis]|uniref:RAB6-interacting golgin n=1 Tax=Dracunculus medinensis TaxID=318479 RepID=A0A0N4U9R9_DRAME|nr:unnamed protein product [Dracunculus medinensis]